MEQKYCKFASIIVLLIGLICISWFFMDAFMNTVGNTNVDLLEMESISRILVGIILTGIGYVMYKFIDMDRATPKPVL